MTGSDNVSKRKTRSRYSLQLLGAASVRNRDGIEQQVLLRQVKRFGVLAYLAIHEIPIQRDLLIALFWPDLGKAAAQRALRQTLHFLRRSLEADAFVSLRNAAGIQPQYWSCDVTALEQAFMAEDWEAVVSLYKGEFLQGIHVFAAASELEFWIGETRQRLLDKAHVALRKLAEIKRMTGNDREAIELLRRALAAGIFDEVLLRDLLVLLYQQGDRAGAIEAYERFASRIKADLDVEPALETQSLIRTIRSKSTRKPIESGIRPRYEELPVPLTPLVGREREVDSAVGLIQREDVRLLSITGAGGIGKTRVALEAAAQIASRYDGICFVPLSAASGSFSDQLSHSLRLQQQGADPSTAIVDYLTNRRVLLVFDNFENVLAEVCSLSRILSVCPAVKAIVTSICPLRIPFEFEFALEPLQIAPRVVVSGGQWPLNSAAAALFLQSAETVDSHFSITVRNAEAVLRVCRAVDGIPLGIELAAARVRELPVSELADRLETGVALLGEKHSGRPARHRTMTAAIEWTTQSLEQEDKEMLLALSFCEGTFSLRAAEYVFKRVCNGKSFWTGIETLTERGLTKRPGRQADTEMLATVRTEMRSMAVNLGKARKYREILLRYYSCWLRLGHRNFCRDEEAAWLRQIDREYKTVEALLQWALYRDPIRASRLVSGLWFYWWNRGLAAQGYATIMRLLKNREQLSVTTQGKLLGAAGNLALRGDADGAVGLLREAVELFEARHNADRVGWAVQSLGVALQEQGSLTEAATYLQKGLEIGLATHNGNRVAFCQQMLGKLAYLSALHDDAKRLLVSSLQSAQARKDWSTVAYALCGLGDMAMVQKSHDEAVEHFERARDHFEALGQKIDIASTLERLARLHSLRGEESLAHLLADQSLAMYRAVGYEPGVLKVLVLYADRALMRGDAARAIALLAGVHLHANDRKVEPGLGTSISELDSAARSKVRKREYDILWRKGETLSVDDLVGVALQAGWPLALEPV